MCAQENKKLMTVRVRNEQIQKMKNVQVDVQSDPNDSGLEGAEFMNFNPKLVEGHETTPAPALLVFMLATMVQVLNLGQYISAVLRYVRPS